MNLEEPMNEAPLNRLVTFAQLQPSIITES